MVALVDGANPQVAALLERLRAENIEVEVSDRYARDVSEDSDVGAYIASVDGDRREHARTLGKAIRDCGFTTPLWALADSSRIADVSVLGMVGEVNGFIYLGQQTPTFYAKQVIASITSYGMSLLPPFFGALMGYDSEAKISFACPGHQGGEFYRKSPAGQLFFKHFGEQIFRNDLCNADVELGDLLIHVGPAVDAQRYAAQVFGADRTYFVLNGTSTANKVVTQAVLKRGDLVLFDRNNHKSLHQGALVKAGATPIFLPTARNSFGMIGAVDWDAWDEKSLREQIRTNPMVKDPELYKAERPFRMACIQLATYDGTVYNVRKVMEKIGHLCDYVLWDEAWIGYNAFHPLFTDHSPMRLEKLTPDMAGLFSTQSVHKQGAGFSQASQIHKRDEHIKGQRRFIEHKRFNESFLMYCSTSPFYPLFAALDVNAKIHAGKAGEMLWDRCIALGIEARKKLREYGRHFASTGRDAEEKWFFDPFVPDTVNIRGSKFTPGRNQRCLGRPAHRRAEARAAVLDLRSEGRLARLQGLLGRLCDGRPEQTHAADAGYRPQDRRVPGFRRAGHGACELPARTTHRSREMRSQQHPVPHDAGRGRKQAQLADLQAGEVQESLGSRCAARRGAAHPVCAEQCALCGLLAAQGLQGDARLLSQGERQGTAEARAFVPAAFPSSRCRRRMPTRRWLRTKWTTCRSTPASSGRIAATLALIYPPGIGVLVPGERWDSTGPSPCSTIFRRSRNRSTASPASTTKCRACTRSR